MSDTKNELIATFTRLIPALVAVLLSVMMDIKTKKKKVTILSGILSITIGVGFAFLVLGIVGDYVKSDGWERIVLCVSAILGEKVMYWVMYKFKIDIFLDGITEIGREYVKNKFK